VAVNQREVDSFDNPQLPQVQGSRFPSGYHSFCFARLLFLPLRSQDCLCPSGVDLRCWAKAQFHGPEDESECAAVERSL
jgi:hypothetical protein